MVLYQLSYTRGAVPPAVLHRPENGTGTHCLGTPDYKGPGGGRKVILWGNRVFWGDWADKFGNRCRLITMGRDARVLRFLVASPRSAIPPPSAVMVVHFHVVSPVEKKRTFTVRLPILLGRGEEAKFRIQHDLVSRKHCELFERQGWVYVRDLGSTNGTFLNDEQVPVSTKTVVPPGGIVRVGGLSFAVDYQSPVAVDATTAFEPSGHLEGPGVEESRVGGTDESLREEQPDFQVVHEGEESPAAPAAVAAPEPASVGEAGSADVAAADARADADEVRPPEPTPEPTSSAKQPEGFDFLSAEASTESSADAAQWPAAGAAAADVSDDDQLNSFFKGLK